MRVIGGLFLSMLGGGVAAADHYNGPYDGDQEYGREMARPRWTVLAGEIVYDSGQDRTHASSASVHREART